MKTSVLINLHPREKLENETGGFKQKFAGLGAETGSEAEAGAGAGV